MDARTINPEKLDAFVLRALNDLSAGYGGVMVSLGDKLGLYKVLRNAGPLTAKELATRAGCAERYIREWLNAQAAAGYVDYYPASARYELTPEQAMVLADDTSPVFVPHAWEVPASMWFDEEKAIDAFRTGGGIAWGDHDNRLYCGVAAFFRNAYRANLISDWLPALDGVVERLEAGIRVADIGCGHGHSSILMAEAFPNSRFWGFDVHADSIAKATENAGQAKVADRTTFRTGDAASYPEEGYDLICFFDCLHDMGDPLAAARHAAKSLAEGGRVVLVEPFANDHTEDNFNPIGRLYYAASATLCCAHAISEGGHDALGAQAGEKRLGDIFRKAGFSKFRRATETPFNLILEAAL